MTLDIRPIWRRSERRASSAPGYCTFTATGRPSAQTARWTWPMERGRRGLRGERAEAVAPARAELPGEDGVHPRGGHRGRGVLQPRELLAVRAGDVVGQHGLEEAERLPELHGPALQLAEHLEQLLGGLLLQLVAHLLGGRATDPAAQAEGRAAGEAEGQRGEPGAAAQAAAGDAVVLLVGRGVRPPVPGATRPAGALGPRGEVVGHGRPFWSVAPTAQPDRAASSARVGPAAGAVRRAAARRAAASCAAPCPARASGRRSRPPRRRRTPAPARRR